MINIDRFEVNHDWTKRTRDVLVALNTLGFATKGAPNSRRDFDEHEHRRSSDGKFDNKPGKRRAKPKKPARQSGPAPDGQQGGMQQQGPPPPKLPKPVLGASWQLMSEKQNVPGTLKNGRPSVADVSKWLQDQAVQAGRIRVGKPDFELTEEHIERIANSLTQDILFAYAQDNNAEGWYSRDIQSMMDELEADHPELKTSKGHEFVFKALLAITSNGNEVNLNLRDAEALYEKWKRDGTIKTDVAMGGKSGPSIRMGLVRLREVLKKMSPEDAAELFNADLPAYEIDKLGIKLFPEPIDLLDDGYVKTEKELEEEEKARKKKEGKGKGKSGKKKDEPKAGDGFSIEDELKDEVVPVFAVFGSKIGSFFGNLYGRMDTVTMDRWFMRSFNRNTGELMEVRRDLAKKHAKRVLKSLGKEGFDHGFDLDAVREDLSRIETTGDFDETSLAFDYVSRIQKHYQDSDFTDGREVIKAGTNMWKNVAEENMAPKNGTQRRRIRKIMSRVLEQVKKKHPNTSMAEMQAVLWYHEQRLYKHLGARVSIDTEKSYSSAARKLSAGQIERVRFKWLSLQRTFRRLQA